MYTLFIDTHNENITIILFKDGKIVSKKIKESMMQHSIYTMPLIDEILKENNITTDNINEVVVVNGPGSFTGVRIGVTIAKTMAYLLNISIKEIDALKLQAIMLDKDSIVVEKEKNGKYIGIFNKDYSLKEDYKYLKNSEYEEFIKENEIDEVNIDYEKMLEYLNTLESSNVHAVNPLYVKSIEALK